MRQVLPWFCPSLADQTGTAHEPHQAKDLMPTRLQSLGLPPHLLVSTAHTRMCDVPNRQSRGAHARASIARLSATRETFPRDDLTSRRIGPRGHPYSLPFSILAIPR